MIKTYVVVLLMFFPSLLFSQNWMQTGGGGFHDESFDVETDASGNIYTTGYVTSATVFGGNLNVTTNGYSDVYISKSNSNGSYLWVKTFGGTSADRGLDLTLDNAGNIYVTGYFNGTATFGNITLSAVNNSQDIFVVKLDNAGNVIWAISEGGSEVDIAYAVEVDNLGNVIVTGQFLGTAQIGSNTFNSVIDPNTNLPAFDMFVSKYDANGMNLWSIQGIAKYDDRGLAIETDVNNNIYVTGQFSDTLTIAGSTHNNTIYNAGMLLKLDPSGNEIWFKRLGAFQTLVYDVELDSQGDVFITGDFLGNMAIIGSLGVSFLNGNYTYRIFLIKFDSTGEIIWMEEDDSQSPISSKAITIDSNDDVYLAGTFKCVFNEYADTLGSGVFNSVGFNDVFITKYNKLGERLWMKQYGGPFEDYCSGIAINQINNPIISGGYTNYFNLPIGSNFIPTPGINFNISVSSSCNNMPYSRLKSNGNKDIFIGQPVDTSLSPYFYYNTPNCYNSEIPCLEYTCTDSLVVCEKTSLEEITKTSGNGEYFPNLANPYSHIGPIFNFQWNTGDTTSIINNITTSGLYYVDANRIDGCTLKRDSVYLTVNPLPQLPLLTDDHGFNTQQPHYYNDITICSGDTALVWFTNLDTSYQFSFSTPNGIYNDTLPKPVYIDSNYYTVSVTDTNGCFKNGGLEVIVDYINNDTIVPYIMQVEDTICEGQRVNILIGDSITNSVGNKVPFCTQALVSENWIGSSISVYPYLQDTCLNGFFYPTTTGWYNIIVSFVLGYNNSCGVDTTHYTVQDSVYIVVNPKPTIPITLGGDSLLCPGDTLNLWTDTVVAGFTWSGPNIIYINSFGDSILATQQGVYSYTGTLVDSVTGCTNTNAGKSYMVNVKPNPVIFSNVPDNIICPNDSILLTCQQNAVSYTWFGPLNNIIGNTQSIYANTPGFYHCVIIDADGCELTSNTIELKEYNTPFLFVDPGNELCHSGAIEITVVYSGSPIVNWLPPINSSSSSVTVTQPGVYIVEVTQCGFTFRDSVTITSSNFVASITPLTNLVICPGDTVILTTNPNMVSYEWAPGSFYGQTLITTDTGDYYVKLTNGMGCSSMSDTVNVSFHQGGITPIVSDVTICAADTFELYNLNNGVTTNWFWDSTLTTPAFSGDTLSLFGITSDTVIYVQNTDSFCMSNFLMVSININPASLTPIINGNNSVCFNDSILISTPTITNGTYNWSGPNGFTSSQNTILITPADSLTAGYYYLSISDNQCSSPTDSILINLLALPTISLNLSDTVFKCINDSLLLYANGNYQSIQWKDSSTTDSLIIYTPGLYYTTATSANGCTITSDSIYIFNYPLSIPDVDTFSICYGDSILLTSSSGQIYDWYNDSLVYLTTDSTYQTPALYNSTAYMVSYIDSNGCQSAADFFYIQVSPVNGSPNIYGNTTICEGQTLNLYTDNLPGATYQWTHNSTVVGSSTGIVINNISLADSGVYYLNVNGANCVTQQGSITISVIPLPTTPHILGDTLLCEGATLQLYTNDSLNHTHYWVAPDSIFSTHDTLIINNISQSGNGAYYLSIMDSNGCVSLFDTINITILPSPPTPIIYSDNDVCEGDTLFLTTDTLQGGSYLWSGPNNYNNNTYTDTILNASTANTGNYSITVTDTNGCSSSSIAFIEVFQYPIINLGNDTIVCIDSVFTLEVDPNFSSYIWQDSSSNYFYTVVDSGWHFVTVEYGGGCSTTDSIYITLDSCLANSIANVFTPNGDGINDFFVIKNIEYFPGSRLLIFNRWGETVYESKDYKNNWDGQGQPVGTYFYVFYPNDPSNKLKVQKGYVTILR